ncbi:MAG: Sua5 family C-terminal domain-containing protein, partial [Steroidobacteraceae bacterium]
LLASDLIDQRVDAMLQDHRRVAVLARRPPRKAQQGVTWINASRRADLYAQGLYAALRSLDKAGADLILVEDVPDRPEWSAVRDRLARGAVNTP